MSSSEEYPEGCCTSEMPVDNNDSLPTPPVDSIPTPCLPGLTLKSPLHRDPITVTNSTWTLGHVFNHLHTVYNHNLERTKLIIKGKQYKPENDSELPLSSFNGLKAIVFGPKVDAAPLVRPVTPPLRPQTRGKTLGTTKPSVPESPYRFLAITTLEFLPNTDKARDLLVKLSQDYGIIRAMQKHKLTVQELGEMEPLSNTSVDAQGISRILGKNYGNGLKIVLRLRTDNHAGFRDFKTIRKTLCHELAHNHFSDHNRDFWDFCKEIEKEVEKANSFHRLDGTRGVVADVDRVDFGDGDDYQMGDTDREARARAAEKRMRDGTS